MPTTYAFYLFLFLAWLRGYLVGEMHMTLLASAGYTAIPWIIATIADLAVGGWLIDRLMTRGGDQTRVRKTVLVIGMLLGLAVLGAMFTTSVGWAIMWISIALGGLAAAAPVAWSLPSLISPKGGTGSVGGIMNFAGNLAGAIAPLATGYIVGLTNSFRGAFVAAAIVPLIGVASYVGLLGRIEPIPDQTGSAGNLPPGAVG